METATANSLLNSVIEPLSKATASSIKPIKVEEGDFLEIDLDDKGDRFIVTPVYYREPYEDEDLTEKTTRRIRGVLMVHDRWKSASWQASRTWVRRVPEAHRLHNDTWKMAGTDFTVVIIHHVWPQERLVFLSDGAKILYQYLLTRFLAQGKNSVLTANFKVDGVVPDMPDDFIEHPELPLTDYQKVGLLASLNKESSALFMEQGTGKTAIVVNRINLEGARKRAGKLVGRKTDIYKALVICPKSVRRNWEEEFGRFSVVPGKVSVMRGSMVNRMKCLVDGIRDEEDCAWGACVISTDSVNATWNAIRQVPWDLVVIDESHYIKNPHSKRFRTMKLFNAPHIRARMILTGTPIANTLFDLWAQLEFLGQGLSGFQAFSNFKKFHGIWKQVSNAPVQALVGLKAIPLIQERLSRLTYMITKKEANLQLPDKVYDVYEVQMTPRQTEFYKKMAKQLALEIQEDLEDAEVNKRMTADHILTKLLRLAQITSGHVKWDATVSIAAGIEQIDSVEKNPKVEAIVEMLTDPAKDKNGKTIVWACFNEDVRVVSERLKELGIKHVGYKPQICDEYRVAGPAEAEKVLNTDRDCKVFIGNPASAGTGLNLLGYDRENEDAYDTYVDHQIYMSCNWSAVHRSQSEDRAHRRGTRCNVRITDLTVPGTIDEEIRIRVLKKRQAASAIQDIKEILKSVLKWSDSSWAE
jgi:SNF2 family DNA or RNA helicase